jgi:hypothetical protein
VQDYYQKAEKEQDSEQQPLARSLLQFAAVHGRTRRRGQRHRPKIRPTRLGLSVSFQSRASGLGLRDAAAMRYALDHLRLLVSVDRPGERSGVHRSERPATGSYAPIPVESK